MLLSQTDMSPWLKGGSCSSIVVLTSSLNWWQTDEFFNTLSENTDKVGGRKRQILTKQGAIFASCQLIIKPLRYSSVFGHVTCLDQSYKSTQAKIFDGL